MKDALGVPVDIGDYLYDSRGHCYQILATEKTLQDSRIALCRRHKKRDNEDALIYVRLYGALKIDFADVSLPPAELSKQWYATMGANKEPKVQELRERRILTDNLLREQGVRDY